MLLAYCCRLGLASFAIYLIFIRSIRYLRRYCKQAQYPYRTQEDLSNMTTQHAFEIQKYVMSLEFPLVAEKALQFALFRTYGIPTISKLLCQTTQLSEGALAPRRYADTALLIGEFIGFAPDSDRACSAIARMNYLHGMWGNKISNDDLLYTLSLFVLEIERWIRTYEWRPLTPMEVCAFGTEWKSIGDAMEISFDELAHGPDSFKDGLQFVEDLRLWADAYEKRTMVPNEWNHKLAEETIAILLHSVPGFLKPFGKQVVITLMDARLRAAMLYDNPPSFYLPLVTMLLTARKLFIRYLMPPRPYFLRYGFMTEKPDPKTGRYYQTQYEAEPWYVQPSFYNRWNLTAWTRWLSGRPLPGPGFKPEGYKILELGPARYEKSGQGQTDVTKQKLLSAGRAGCPFVLAKS